MWTDGAHFAGTFGADLFPSNTVEGNIELPPSLANDAAGPGSASNKLGEG